MSTDGKPLIEELRPNIYQIRIERPGSNVYLVKGSNKNVLIDTGMGANFENVKAGLADVGLKPEHIHLVILTHEHFDHIGASYFFMETAIIAAHRFTANKIKVHDEFVIMSKYHDRNTRPFKADLHLDKDMVIDLGNYQFRVLHTPGHTSGCICLYEPTERFAFTGDTVLAGGALSGIYGSGNISDYLMSLEQLQWLRIDEFYPGHGKASKSAKEDIEKALAGARRLLDDSRLFFETLDTTGTFRRIFLSLRGFPLPEEERTEGSALDKGHMT
jgi:hydroxyacylglutathione hydrolase